jgi:hypothetical protein
VHEHHPSSSHSLVDKVTNTREVDEQVLKVGVIKRDGEVVRTSGWVILENGYDVRDLVSREEPGVNRSCQTCWLERKKTNGVQRHTNIRREQRSLSKIEGVWKDTVYTRHWVVRSGPRLYGAYTTIGGWPPMVNWRVGAGYGRDTRVLMDIPWLGLERARLVAEGGTSVIVGDDLPATFCYQVQHLRALPAPKSVEVEVIQFML